MFYFRVGVLLLFASFTNQQRPRMRRDTISSVLGDSFRFISLPHGQKLDATQNQFNYKQQFTFGQQQPLQLQQQQYQQPATIQFQYDNKNSQQHLTQTTQYQQQPQYYLSPIQQQQQQQQQQNVYQFQSLTNANQHNNNNNNQHSNPNQNRIQTQQYSQLVPSTIDNGAVTMPTTTNPQQFNYPFSYAGLTKSQQQQQQQQQQHQQQYSQFNQQQFQRNSPEYEHLSSTANKQQPASFEMSTAFIRRLSTQQQPQQQQQRQQQQSSSSKPSVFGNDDNKISEFLPSYFTEAAEETPEPMQVCTQCCQLHQNPCLQCCSEDPFLSAATLKLLAG